MKYLLKFFIVAVLLLIYFMWDLRLKSAYVKAVRDAEYLKAAFICWYNEQNSPER